QRVEPAFLVLRRSERCAVVEVGAPIPVAVPAELQHPGQPAGLAPIVLRSRAAASLLADRGVLFQQEGEDPSEPHALAASEMADAVHAVVPVAAPDERQAVRAVFPRPTD